MRLTPLLFFLPAIVFAAESVPQQTCEHGSTVFRCVKFVKNYDADTITVDIPGIHPLLGKHISVRVAHIDTPEIKTKDKCEKAAGKAAQRLIENMLKSSKRIDLTNVRRDKYFRILADVEIDGKSLKDTLLKNKLGYSYEGGTKQHLNWCEKFPAK